MNESKAAPAKHTSGSLALDTLQRKANEYRDTDREGVWALVLADLRSLIAENERNRAERDEFKKRADELAEVLDETIATAKAWSNPPEDDVIGPPGPDEIYGWYAVLDSYRRATGQQGDK